MSALRLLQDSFQWALMAQQPVRPGLLAQQGHFAVYLQAYRARLLGALRENYAVLAQVMGDEDFEALSGHYIALQPSTHYSLRWFGHQLPGFMQAHSLWVPHPALTDLARLERALRDAFDAADAPALAAPDLQHLAPADWPRLRLGLQPSVQVLRLGWAVGPVWNALQSGEAEVPAPEALQHSLLVWRQGLQPRWMSLDAGQTQFLHALRAGKPFGLVCEQLAQSQPQEAAVAQAAGLLHEFIASGVLCQSTPPTGCAASFSSRPCTGDTYHGN